MNADTDGAPVSLNAAHDGGRPGSVTLTLHNGAEEPVGFNLCTSALERRSGDAWQPVPENRVCTMELRTLLPGGEAMESIDLPAGTTRGTFRYSTGIEMMTSGERVSVSSNVFQIGG